MREAIDVAQKIGAKIVAGPIFGAVGKLEALSKAKKINWLRLSASGLRDAGKYASDLGVKLAVEPLNRYDTSFINTSAEALALIDEVNSDSVGLLLDTFHVNIEEEDFYNPFLIAGSKLFHIHSSESNRGIPGNGTVNWKQVSKALRKIKYNRLCIIESFVPNDPVFSSAMRTWRSQSQDQDHLAEKGLTYLKSVL